MTPPSLSPASPDAACTLRLTFDSGQTLWADMSRSEAEGLLTALSRADPFALVPVPGTSRRVAPAHIAVWSLEDAPSSFASPFAAALPSDGLADPDDPSDGTGPDPFDDEEASL